MSRPRARSWWRKEHGFSSAALTVLLLPVILGVFGLGFEVARATYLRIWIQGKADNAAFTGTTFSTVNASGNFTFKDTALSETYKNYQANTLSHRTSGLFGYTASQVANNKTSGKCYGQACYVYANSIDCGTGATPPAYPTGKSAKAMCNFYFGITLTVRESIPSSFLRLVGVQSIDLPPVTGTALAKPQGC